MNTDQLWGTCNTANQHHQEELPGKLLTAAPFPHLPTLHWLLVISPQRANQIPHKDAIWHSSPEVQLAQLVVDIFWGDVFFS
jgi:hypothetical protein